MLHRMRSSPESGRCGAAIGGAAPFCSVSALNRRHLASARRNATWNGRRMFSPDSGRHDEHYLPTSHSSWVNRRMQFEASPPQLDDGYRSGTTRGHDETAPQQCGWVATEPQRFCGTSRLFHDGALLSAAIRCPTKRGGQCLRVGVVQRTNLGFVPYSA